MTGTPRLSEADWRDGVDDVAPTVVILGGFLTAPILYKPLRRRLLARGAADVVIANVWTTDWLLVGLRGIGPIVRRAATAIGEGQNRAAANPLTRGTPLLVVGHSGGGIVGRILTAEVPIQGRRHALAPAIGALVTLGSPHRVGGAGLAGRRVGGIAARLADRVVPGAAFAPQVGYVAVASRAVSGHPRGTGTERVAHRLYTGLLDDPSIAEEGGDGVVPVRSALLVGAQQVVLEGIRHGQGSGRPWYGADPALDVWWPVAIDAWRSALRVRAARTEPRRNREPSEVPTRTVAAPGSPEPRRPDDPPRAGSGRGSGMQ